MRIIGGNLKSKKQPAESGELTTGRGDKSLCDAPDPITAPAEAATKIPVILVFAPISHRAIVLLDCAEVEVLRELGPDCDALVDRIISQALNGGGAQ